MSSGLHGSTTSPPRSAHSRSFHLSPGRRIALIGAGAVLAALAAYAGCQGCKSYSTSKSPKLSTSYMQLTSEATPVSRYDPATGKYESSLVLTGDRMGRDKKTGNYVFFERDVKVQEGKKQVKKKSHVADTLALATDARGTVQAPFAYHRGDVVEVTRFGDGGPGTIKVVRPSTDTRVLYGEPGYFERVGINTFLAENNLASRGSEEIYDVSWPVSLNPEKMADDYRSPGDADFLVSQLFVAIEGRETRAQIEAKLNEAVRRARDDSTKVRMVLRNPGPYSDGGEFGNRIERTQTGRTILYVRDPRLVDFVEVGGAILPHDFSYGAAPYKYLDGSTPVTETSAPSYKVKTPSGKSRTVLPNPELRKLEARIKALERSCGR